MPVVVAVSSRLLEHSLPLIPDSSGCHVVILIIFMMFVCLYKTILFGYCVYSDGNDIKYDVY